MLQGVKILSFTHYLQGPFAAQTLADLGADVVKVEPTSGSFERNWSGGNRCVNGVSLFFLIANRNQHSLAIDLKTNEGREIIYRLVQEYDVVVTNYRPGVMDRLGFSYETLSAMNPRLIFCSCTGWGEDGPLADMPGQDLLAQSVSGLAAQNGSGDHPPQPMGVSIVDVHGGTLAALGIIAAVYNREKTGKGRLIATNLLNAAMDLQAESLGYYMNTGVQMPRASTGLGSRFHYAPYGIYKTKDGCVCLNGHGREDCLKKAFGEDFFNMAPFSFENRMEIDQKISEALIGKTTAEWSAIFDTSDIWYAPVNEYPDTMTHPQVIHNDIILKMEHPVAGEVRVVNHANQFDGASLSLRKRPPDLGDATAHLLETHGYGSAEINRLAEKGIVKLC